MTKFTLTKDEIFRDAKTYYKNATQRIIGPAHLNFCKKHAGKKILDFGCATGDYCLELSKFGFECIGVDINEEYIKIAKQKGVDAYLIKDGLPFSENLFNTVILIEVLEHSENPGWVLEEAKRVAKKNILVTVPNCEGFESLRKYGLTYAHFLAIDHKHFFTKDSLEKLFSNHFNNFKITRELPMSPCIFSPSHILGNLLIFLLRKFVGLLQRIGILKTDYYTHLFAIITLDKEI